MIEALQGTAPLAVRRWEQEAVLGTRDPVCGMPLLGDGDRPRAEYHGRAYAFCHEECRRRFVRTPELYLAAAADRADSQALGLRRAVGKDLEGSS